MSTTTSITTQTQVYFDGQEGRTAAKELDAQHERFFKCMLRFVALTAFFSIVIVAVHCCF
jgi:hypothetical protein